MPEIDVLKRSLELEEHTGYDSIYTIERCYLTDDSGRFICVFPRCDYAVGNAEQMWRHVHGLASRSPHPNPFTRDDLLESVEAS